MEGAQREAERARVEAERAALGCTDAEAASADAEAWLALDDRLRFLSLLRVLRLLRLVRFSRSFDEFAKIAELLGFRAFRVFFSLACVFFVAAGLVYEAEHRTNPGFGNYFDALYFVCTTLTTVGFGDVVPETAPGKAIVSLAILTGAAVVPLELSELARSLADAGEDGAGVGAL
eukprot:PRCOL_00002379-RA